jgi:hypothetical protein
MSNNKIMRSSNRLQRSPKPGSNSAKHRDCNKASQAATKRFNQMLFSEAKQVEETPEHFIEIAVKQRIEFLKAGMDPRTAGIRALNQIMYRFDGRKINRIFGNKTLSHAICGSDLYDHLSALADDCGLAVEEILLVVMRKQLKKFQCLIDKEWILPEAEFFVSIFKGRHS